MFLRQRRLAFTLLALALPLTAAAGNPPKVSLSVTNGEVRQVIGQLAGAARVEVRCGPEVRGRVTAQIKDTPFEKALSAVTDPLGFGWRRDGAVYVVGRFRTTTGAAAANTAKIPVKGDPAVLARAFGHVDLAGLDTPGGLDLRALLPPDLDAPPRPLVGEGCLEATGTPAALADLRHLIESLERTTATLRYRWLLGEVSPALLRSLPIYWAQGAMDFGRSEGRQPRYSVGDFHALEQQLAAGPEGFREIARGEIAARELATVSLDTAAGAPAGPVAEQARLALTARIEPGLAVRLWLSGTFSGVGGSFPLGIDGGLVPPEEASVLVSMPASDGSGSPAAPVLLLVRPMVEAE